MKRIFLALTMSLAISLLTGCAGCTHSCILGFGPGNPTFTAIAKMHDNPMSQPAGNYNSPTYIYNNSGQTVGRIGR